MEGLLAQILKVAWECAIHFCQGPNCTRPKIFTIL